MGLIYYYRPVYKIEFWSGSNKLRGFGYGYDNKELVSFKIKPGLTKALGTFDIKVADTGSGTDGFAIGNAFKNVEIFDTVKMWWGYTGSGLTPPTTEMFTGRIDTKEIDFGENGYYRTYTGRDMGEPLTRTYSRQMRTGSTSSTVIYLKDKAGLSPVNTYISGSPSLYNIVMDNTSCLDGIIEVSDFDNMDAYTDTGSHLYWFTRNINLDATTSFAEGVNIFSYKLIKDLAVVKNDYYIFGIRDSSGITGSDWPVGHDDWTEYDFSRWSGSFTRLGDAPISTLVGYTTEAGRFASGSASIQTYMAPLTTGSGLYESYELHLILDMYGGYPSGQSLKLNHGDYLHIYTWASTANFTPIYDAFYIRLVTTGSSYYECKLEAFQNQAIQERTIPCGPSYEGISITGSDECSTGSYRWTRIGEPDWYDIRYLDYCYIFTGSQIINASELLMTIDGLYFSTHFQYHTSGSASITAYGQRPEFVHNNKINSYGYAKNYGDTLLTMNQVPPTQIELYTTARPYQVGTQYPLVINSESINSNYELIDLEYVWESNELKAKCIFTNQPQYRVIIPMFDFPVQQAIKEKDWMQQLADWMYKQPNRL